MTVWQPGMHAQCVHVGEMIEEFRFMTLPEVGRVYTVRDVSFCDFSGVAALYLEEIRNADGPREPLLINGALWIADGEPGFQADWFRPLSATRLDTLRALLAPSPREMEPA